MFVISILFGYVSGSQPGPQPDSAFRFLISVFPAAGTLLVWMLARQFFLEIALKPAGPPAQAASPTAGD
jgi:GPH family glycoside/pentoside/hexuronide:cation symporter